MSLQYASFFLPLYPDSEEEAELNRFLRGHRVLSVRRKLDDCTSPSRWLFLIEYHAESSLPDGGSIKGKNRIDYKEILSPADFAVFSKLRELRKKLAEDAGIPVHAVFTNDQLAEMARLRPGDATALKAIDGIGDARVEKFGAACLELVAKSATGDEKSGIPF
jgi:superfamily II DNA helicase RecQ